METTRKLKLNAVLEELYKAITISFLVFIALELGKPGIVSSYLNLNYWLIGWFIGGILVVYNRKK
jgi:hypothetical protein